MNDRTKDLNSVPDAMLTPHGKELAKAQRTSNPLVMTPSEIARFLADCRTLIAHSRTFYEVRDALSYAVWLIERNMRPDETDRDGSAKCPHCLTWRTAEEIGKGMCCDKDVPPEEPSENPERNSASQGYPQVDPRHEVSDSVAAKVGAAVVGSETIGSEKASAPLDREAVNALALQCAQASAVVRNREWNFDRYRNGKLKAQGVTVHAATEAEAWEKARSLLHIDGNMPTDELRLQPLNGDGDK